MSAGTVPPEVIDRLKATVGPGGYIDDPAELAPYLSEIRGLFHGRTPLLLRPHTTAEVAAITTICAESRTPIVPQGGNTGLMGGAVPHESGDEIVVSLTRLKRIRAVDTVNNAITVEAGCVLAEVQQAAADARSFVSIELGSGR